MKSTIEQDCVDLTNLINKDKLYCQHIYLQEDECSKLNGLYSLMLNGAELWYGTLEEINAVVKSMIRPLDNPKMYDWEA